ncbi:Hsp20 family protein [candidate division WOR-3 bacterium]|nr:Hsp20 family protein [candidate division WOR-3 bacterium]
MKCEQILLWVSDYVDGELPHEKCVELEKHLTLCPRCRSIVNTLKTTIALYQKVELYKLPTSIHQSLHQMLRHEWEIHETKVDVKSLKFPPMELIEKKKEFLLLIELPGLKKEDLTLTAKPRSIEISGFNKQIDGIYYIKEIKHGWFLRAIELPASIDISKADAQLKNGLLQIRFPKSMEDLRG